MNSFEQIRSDLFQATRQKERTRLNLHRAREGLKKIEALQARLDRFFDPQHDGHQSRRRDLAERRGRLEAEIESQAAALDKILAEEGRLFKEFVPLSDPRVRVEEKDATVPFLLLPVRLETRFKVVDEGDGSVNQLWVRVYPDQCMIDSFEEVLSESEVTSLRKFWVNWVKAGGIEDQQRGAWRSLVAGFGSGRAAWAIERFRPVGPAVLPEKASPNDIILVVASEQPLSDAEKPAVATYWRSIWLSGDDPGLQQAAFEALSAALGAERATEIVEAYEPENLSESPTPPRTRADVSVEVLFLELPEEELFETQRLAWSQPPRVHVLPERFVLVGFRGGNKVLEALGAPIPSPLVVGPDPLASEEGQIRPDGSDLAVSDDMKWMVDFDMAVRSGMAFRVNISPQDAAEGFDRLLVLGVKLTAAEQEGKELVEALISNHQRGTSGFSILPQGIPTNNTEGRGSGFSESEDADESFELVFGNPSPLAPTSDFLTRTDGQWLADVLGIDLATFEKTPNSRGTDQCEARAMNTVLWPATWGYLMESMMRPVFDDDMISKTRWFFTHFVTGRGLAPAVRIEDQPYGILPTTALSRMAWLDGDDWLPPQNLQHPEGYRAFLGELKRVLTVMRGDWERMAEDVAFVGKNGDPHQILLDVVGLNPATVEYYQRYAESLEELANRLKLSGLGGALIIALIALGYAQSGMDLLASLGYTEEEVPEILEKFFLNTPNLLQGDLIDDKQLSESSAIRNYTEDGKNYIEWLVAAVEDSLDTLRREEGFVDDQPPTALLYLLLRYALEQGYWDAGLRLFQDFGVLTAAEAATARIDPSFVHVADALPTEFEGRVPAAEGVALSNKPIHFDRRSESRYDFLYQSEPAITKSQDRLIGDFIPEVIGRLPATRYLDEQLRALRKLQQTPTARLERVLAEHLDLCTYRLDAWRWGLLHYQVASLRYSPWAGEAEAGTRTGTYIGAFGWLEHVRSEDKQLTPVDLSQVDEELDAIFNPEGTAPVLRDDTNAGYIQAPSLNHAITAAVLRNGYLSNATPDNPEGLAVKLSSARVRTALGVIEGIRSEQRLGALLGYQLERGLHDRHTLAEVDFFIFKLRKAFPLVSEHMTDTQTPDGEPIEAVEARNVVDGLALVNHINESGETSYPFGKSLPPADDAQAAIIEEEVNRIRDIHDSLADLALAESVYQAIQGNYSRTGATLEAYSKGTFPPEPEVIQTPRSGIHLTHRVGLHFEPGLDASVSPNGLSITPRVSAEPAINKWLNGVLPDPDLVVCQVRYVDPSDDSLHELEVSQAQLGLQPLDLLYVLDTEADQAMSELDDRVVHHVVSNESLRPDAEISIAYTERSNGTFSFFEVGAMVRSLRGLILRSRPLSASDVALVNEATRSSEGLVSVAQQRVTAPLAQLEELLTDSGGGDDLQTLTADMDALLGDTLANRSQIIDEVEGWSDRYADLAVKAAWFGIPQAGTGFIYAGKRGAFGALLEKLDELEGRWQARLDEFDDLISQVPGLGTDEEKFDTLLRAEPLVSTQFTTPTPGTVAAYEAELQTKRTQFEDKLDSFRALRQTPPATISGLLGGIDGELPLDAFDVTGLDLLADEDEMIRFALDLQTRAAALSTEITNRRDSANDHLAEAGASASAPVRVQSLFSAAKAIFGQDFKLVPEFALLEEQGSEWEKAWNDSSVLLQYLTNAAPAGVGLDFPVDDWLYGVARVREKLGLWENTVMLASAFGSSEPALTPIQLPYRSDDRWLALRHPEDYDFEGDRLLYMAHYSVPFDRSTNQCGLLLDEWTEIIPSQQETTGITFHYDRPNSEPPQTILLVLSPAFTGSWQWGDLVDALLETLDEARLRAVEPAQVDGTAYARFLPAAIMAVTRHPITIGLNLALNNQVMSIMGVGENG